MHSCLVHLFGYACPILHEFRHIQKRVAHLKFKPNLSSQDAEDIPEIAVGTGSPGATELNSAKSNMFFPGASINDRMAIPEVVIEHAPAKVCEIADRGKNFQIRELEKTGRLLVGAEKTGSKPDTVLPLAELVKLVLNIHQYCGEQFRWYRLHRSYSPWMKCHLATL
jgi:hypothetical protein